MRRFDPRNLVKDTYSLVLLCGYTLQPVSCGPDGNGYEFTKMKPGIASFLEKVSPLITLSLMILKVAVTMYGIPLPLPNVINFTKDDTIAYLNDTMSSLGQQYQPIISNGLGLGLGLTNNNNDNNDSNDNDNDDISNQMNISYQCHRDAYDALVSFFSSYHPPNYGLRKCTSSTGVTMWIKDDDNVEETFQNNNGKRHKP